MFAGNRLPRGYAHGHDGMRGKLESLINTLGANGNSAAVHGTASHSSSPMLQGLLHGMLLHLQQQGSWAAAAGHVVHVVA